MCRSSTFVCHCLYPADYKLNFEQQKILITYLKSKDIEYHLSFKDIMIDEFIIELYDIKKETIYNLLEERSKKLNILNTIAVLSLIVYSD
jgi:hypothetical protein